MTAKKLAGRNIKFPLPSDYAAKDVVVFCPSDRIISLYNQHTHEGAKRLSAKVRNWFREQAYAHGWAGVQFLPVVQTKHGAGCAMWKPSLQVNMQVAITRRTLVLIDDDSNDSAIENE